VLLSAVVRLFWAKNCSREETNSLLKAPAKIYSITDISSVCSNTLYIYVMFLQISIIYWFGFTDAPFSKGASQFTVLPVSWKQMAQLSNKICVNLSAILALCPFKFPYSRATSAVNYYSYASRLMWIVRWVAMKGSSSMRKEMQLAERPIKC
jgi:hypothetical protein